MRILMLTQFYPPVIGGEERHARDLAILLAQRGHWVGVATIRRGGLPEHEIDEGVHVFRISGLTQKLFADKHAHAPPFPDPGFVAALQRIVVDAQIDVVHAHNWLLHSFLPLKRANGPRLVVTLHDLSLVCATKQYMHGFDQPCSGPGLAKCLACATRHYGARGPAIVAGQRLSSYVERKLVDRFLPVSYAVAIDSKLPDWSAPYEVIPNFVRDDVAMLNGGAEAFVEQLPKEPFLLFVGAFRRLKGISVLLNAYAELRDAPPLVMIGTKCPDSPGQWPANVRVLYDWPHSAVMHAWNRCLAGIVPSIWSEACATTLIEGMASGKAMIASSAGGNPEIVEHNVSGLIVEPGNIRSLSRTIHKLITDEPFRQRLSAGALQKVKAFKASSVVPRIEAVYREIISEKRLAEIVAIPDVKRQTT